MDKILEKLFDLAWRTKPGRCIVLCVLVISGLMVLWNSLPEELQVELFRSVTKPTAPSSQIDILIAPFKVSDPDEQHLSWLKTKVERKFVEFYTARKWKTQHKLVTEQASGKPVGQPLGLANYTINGEIRNDGNGKTSLSVYLLDSEGLTLGSASLEQTPEFFKEVYRDLPETIFFAMGLDPIGFKPTTTRPSTHTPAAYAYYLHARRLSQVSIEGAMEVLRTAIGIDPNFAMAHWALGQLSEKAGDDTAAERYYSTARSLDPDHAKQPIFVNVPRPLPTLYMAIKDSGWREVDEGLYLQIVEAKNFDITIYAIRFDSERYALRTIVQRDIYGNEVREFVDSTGAILAVNGGFFEVDSEDRISPSGALYVEGLKLSPYQQRGGSGFLYDSGTELGIQWSTNIDSIQQIQSGVQSGPLVVDPGGKNGIYSDDHDQRRRTAICLRGSTATILLVDGGLSLFELGSLLSRESRQGGYQCERAINLDGGPSSQLYLSRNGVELDIKGTWKTNNAVLLVPRKGKDT